MKQQGLILAALIGLGAVTTFGPVAKAADEADAKPAVRERGERPNPRERMKKMEEDLKLTDDQKSKFEAAMKEQNEKVKALRDDASLDKKEQAEKVAEIRKATAAKIKTILTPDQFEKWEKMTQRPNRGENQRRQKKEEQ